MSTTKSKKKGRVGERKLILCQELLYCKETDTVIELNEREAEMSFTK